MPSEPIGYLITFRTYGTWLHGDQRGSVNSDHRCYGADFVPPNRAWERQAARNLAEPVFHLSPASRKIVEHAITQTCELRNWTLRAVNARTEHVHLVISAPRLPEPIMNSLKSWCTLRLREANHIPLDYKPWSKHGSTIYLWNEHSLNEAIRYVTESQG